MVKRIYTWYQQTITNIVTGFDRWALSLRLRRLKIELAQYADRLVQESPESKRTLVTQLLQHLLTPTSTNRSEINQTFMMMKITQLVCINLNVDAFVGVQPVTSPVSQVYTIRFGTSSDDNNTTTLNVLSAAVECVSRRLTASWSTEVIDDLTLHGFNAFDECCKMLAQEIVDEITTEVMLDVTNVAIKNTSQAVDVQGVCEEIDSLCNQIASDTRRGHGNVILVSSIMFDIIRRSPLFNETSSYGVSQHVGTYKPNIPVYRSSNLTGGQILIGYKGTNGECDVGVIYSPYQLIRTVGVVTDSKFTSRMRLMSRYAIYTDDDSCKYYRLVQFPNISN